MTSPPHAVNVPFISSHIKVSRSLLEPNLLTWQFYFPWRLFLKHFLIFYLKLNSIFLVIRNCCISMSEIELFSGELSFDVADLCFPCSYIKIVFHSNLQSITLNKKDDTCPLVDTNLSAWIELSLWRCKRCHEHSMVKFVSTRGYLILPLYVCVTEQVWA